MEHHELRVDSSYLESLGSKPLKGVVELIANALDADATRVEVAFEKNEIDGIASLVVADDGHGMAREDAIGAFDLLGGSWKASARRTKQLGRVLHGKRGVGRFRIFGAANSVTWTTVATDPIDGERKRMVLQVRAENRKRYSIMSYEPTSEPLGTTVKVHFSEAPDGLGWDVAEPKLLAAFAIYLDKYSPVVVYDGNELDPSTAIAKRTNYPLEGQFTDSAELDIVEWETPPRKRTICLCNEAGMSLHEIEPHVQTPGFKFTAYVQWRGFETRADQLEIAELDGGDLGAVLIAAEEAIREHYRRRQEELRREIVLRWQQDDVYPFTGSPRDVVDRARRETFDVVAVSAAQTINAGSSVEARRLSLRLIREALDENPGNLHHILAEVLQLPPERLEDLHLLLDRTPLSSIISAAKTITDRLGFLRALEMLVLDPDIGPEVRERSQLHRILADETWIFGDEFALTVDDQGLKVVLEQHLQILGRESMAEDDPRDSEGRRCIVDLMLSQLVPQARNRREHLIVELKAPAVAIGDTELAQAMRYADAVSRHPRFNTVDVEWDFIVVSGRTAGSVDLQRTQRNRQPGLVLDGDVRVWVKTWGEIIEDATQRLKFVQRSLEYAATDEHALDYLRRTHDKLLPSRLREVA